MVVCTTGHTQSQVCCALSVRVVELRDRLHSNGKLYGMTSYFWVYFGRFQIICIFRFAFVYNCFSSVIVVMCVCVCVRELLSQVAFQCVALNSKSVSRFDVNIIVVDLYSS